MSKSGVGEYRLLLFQPDPESGERICVGVAVDGDLLYDLEFSRVRCFSQKLPPEIMRFYLRDIRNRIAHSRADEIERILKDFAPMFLVSAPRKIVDPITESIRLMLLRRFVNKGEIHGPSRMQIRKQYFGRLKDFTSKVVGSADYRMIENASPLDVFGEKRRGVGRVALAVKREDRILLMDGLDLNVLDPTAVVQTSARVVHTFWQYGRTPMPYGETLRRVAVVFNGRQQEAASSRDAHAFALDQFRKGADETIEASSGSGEESLASLLV